MIDWQILHDLAAVDGLLTGIDDHFVEASEALNAAATHLDTDTAPASDRA